MAGTQPNAWQGQEDMSKETREHTLRATTSSHMTLLIALPMKFDHIIYRLQTQLRVFPISKKKRTHTPKIS